MVGPEDILERGEPHQRRSIVDVSGRIVLPLEPPTVEVDVTLKIVPPGVLDCRFEREYQNP